VSTYTRKGRALSLDYQQATDACHRELVRNGLVDDNFPSRTACRAAILVPQDDRRWSFGLASDGEERIAGKGRMGEQKMKVVKMKARDLTPTLPATCWLRARP